MFDEPLQEIFSRQDAKSAKKSPFHPPFAKGKEGDLRKLSRLCMLAALQVGVLRVISFPILQANIQPRSSNMFG
jgi:hypothetical protein